MTCWQATSSDGRCQISDDSSVIEHSATGHEGFRVQFHLIGLPVAGNFVDRDTEMEQIENSLLQSDPQGGRKIHVLHGLGGIGKTQLAIAYARKHQDVYSAIIWVNGNSKDTLFQSLAAFAIYARNRLSGYNDMMEFAIAISSNDKTLGNPFLPRI